MVSVLKRKRGSDELAAEYERQASTLNRAFVQWLDNNKEANAYATWEEGCKDYLSHVSQLKAKFLSEGEAMSCGTGDCGQLGFGVEEPTDLDVSRFRAIETLAGTDISAIAAGGLHNAVVASDTGRVWTWGCADDGTLGRDGDENYPALVGGLLSKVFIVGVSAGDSHTAALSMSGQVFIWGSYKDKDGKNWFRAPTGNEAFKKTQDAPVLVEEVSNVSKNGGVTQISSGAGFTLALCGDGTVYSWGIGECGQLGRPVCELKDGDLYLKEAVVREHLTPAVMQYNSGEDVKNARMVAAGNHHTFVIAAVRSRVFGCGLNQYGQLALDDGTDTKTLQQIKALDDLSISTIVGAEHSSLAITHDGHVYTFGRADNNQLGVPDAVKASEAGEMSRTPLRVTFDPPATITSAACGSFHCLAVSDKGHLYSWGFGEMAQLGHGRSRDENKPRLVLKKKGGDPIVVSCVSAGAQHTVVLSKQE
mmetsp:Transcript_16043/g.29333  ORF Transcript_16043/g.29333 Transcript_16043/m.29333 type:complete len:477 (+) Transcript_16043:128-1558(+)